MDKEMFAKLINLIGIVGGDVVFMHMKSRCEGLMTTEQVKYTPETMEFLLHLADEQGISVRFVPFQASDGRLKWVKDEVRIGIRISMSFDEYIYNLAHELAHYFLHYDKGDTINSEKHSEYEEQADRAAKMLLTALSVK